MTLAMNPVLTIIMPVYNASRYVAQAIEGILEQTYDDFELIIADDGSTDGSREIIERYKDQRIILSPNSSNLGKTTTVNRIFKTARGRYVTIHDADDVSEPSRFEIQLETLDRDSSMVLCGSNFSVMNAEGKVLRASRLHLSDADLKAGLW